MAKIKKIKVLEPKIKEIKTLDNETKTENKENGLFEDNFIPSENSEAPVLDKLVVRQPESSVLEISLIAKPRKEKEETEWGSFYSANAERAKQSSAEKRAYTGSGPIMAPTIIRQDASIGKGRNIVQHMESSQGIISSDKDKLEPYTPGEREKGGRERLRYPWEV